MKIKKLTLMSVMLGLALIVFTIESQLPPIVPIPGIKLGLANTINLIVLYMLGRKESFTVLVSRIVLGSIFAGNITGFMYSLSGGLISFAFIATVSVFLKENRMWVVSVFGAIGHNIGQIIFALFLLKTPQLILYLPILTVSGVITGFFTGAAAQLTLKRLHKTKYVKELSEEENYA